MREVLCELNKVSGVTGSMLVGNDGIVIASDLDSQFEDEAIGALASSISSTVSRSLERLDQTPLDQLTIEADKGKLIIATTPVGYLVVTTEEEINLGLVRLEIKYAISQISM